MPTWATITAGVLLAPFALALLGLFCVALNGDYPGDIAQKEKRTGKRRLKIFGSLIVLGAFGAVLLAIIYLPIAFLMNLGWGQGWSLSVGLFIGIVVTAALVFAFETVASRRSKNSSRQR